MSAEQLFVWWKVLSQTYFTVNITLKAKFASHYPGFKKIQLVSPFHARARFVGLAPICFLWKRIETEISISHTEKQKHDRACIDNQPFNVLTHKVPERTLFALAHFAHRHQRPSPSSTGWPVWANFRHLGDRFLRAILFETYLSTRSFYLRLFRRRSYVLIWPKMYWLGYILGEFLHWTSRHPVHQESSSRFDRLVSYFAGPTTIAANTAIKNWNIPRAFFWASVTIVL
jgi:hypothetical protein